MGLQLRVSQSQSAAIGRHIKNADGSDMHATTAAYDRFAQLKARATSAQDRAAIARITAHAQRGRPSTRR